MAKNMEPIVKRCRALGISPAVMGYSANSSKGNSTKRNPNAQKRVKKTEYALQPNEKQKIKFIYGLMEKQLRMYYEKAFASSGITGEVLLSTVERRLDNVVFRLGFATTRRSARQMVTHGHYTVNGKRVDIASYLVKPGDEIAVCGKSMQNEYFKKLREDNAFNITPKWLERDTENLKGKVVAMPARDDIDYDVAEHLIVELYSK